MLTHFENVGTPSEASFTEVTTSPFDLVSVYPLYTLPSAGDADGDEDLDLLVGLAYRSRAGNSKRRRADSRERRPRSSAT